MSEAPTWMIEGKPGMILQASVAAVKTAGERDLKNRGGEKGVSAQDVIDAAREAFTANDIAMTITAETLSVEGVGREGTQPYARMMLRIKCIASDGSFLEHVIPAGGSARNLKHMQAAVTAGMKSFYKHVLMLSISEQGNQKDNTKKPRRMSAQLLAHIKFLETVSTVEGMENTGNHETAEKLKAGDLDAARWHWQQRLDKINQLQGAGWRQKDYRDRETAKDTKRAKDARKEAETTGRSSSRGAPIDMSDTRPLKQKPGENDGPPPDADMNTTYGGD